MGNVKFELDDETHKQAKAAAALRGEKLQEFLSRLVTRETVKIIRALKPKRNE